MLYTFFALAMGSYLFYSSSAGPASVQVQDRTGSPIAAGFCGNNGCHASGAFGAGLTISVTDGTNTVTSYQPEVTYTVRVNVTDDGNASTYGYQAVALDAGNNNAGSMGFPNAGQQLVTLASGIEYMEHSTPSNSGSFEFSWTAPAAGTGDVTLYSGGIAADGGGSSAGDGSALGNVMLTEMVSDIFQVEQLPVSLDIYPNPVQDQLNLSIQSDISGSFDLNIYDLKGQLLQQEVISLSATTQQQNIQVNDLPKGNYLLQLTDGVKMATKKMIKL